MRRRCAPLRAAAALLRSALLLHCATARAGPANTINELSAKIDDCLRPVRAPAASSFTVLFSLKRDGGLLGRPRITYSDLKGDPGDQKRFVEDALAAINRCLPIAITDGLGGAIAGRPIVVRIGPSRRATDL